MTSLIVFDSFIGDTKLIAYAVSDALTDFGEVIVKKTDEETIIDVNVADILIIGSPTYHRKPSGMVMQFVSELRKNNGNDLPFVSFDTRYNTASWMTGSASKWISKKLGKKNYKLLLPPESFFINRYNQNLEEYESRRASKWGQQIGEKYFELKEQQIDIGEK